MIPEPLRAVFRVIDVLEELGISYHVAGSFASSVHGVPRQTHDLDLVADLNLPKISGFVARLQDDFYVDVEMIRTAIQRGISFNIIHLESGFKIDIFGQGRDFFDRSELKRSRPRRLQEDIARKVIVQSAEDTVLRKLLWYRMGREISDRQWNDILGILKVQGKKLDRDYLEYWAGELEIFDLLERAFEET